MLWGIRPPIGVRHFAVRGGCYPPRPSASVRSPSFFASVPKQNSIILFYYLFKVFLSSKQACILVHLLRCTLTSNLIRIKKVARKHSGTYPSRTNQPLLKQKSAKSPFSLANRFTGYKLNLKGLVRGIFYSSLKM